MDARATWSSRTFPNRTTHPISPASAPKKLSAAAPANSPFAAPCTLPRNAFPSAPSTSNLCVLTAQSHCLTRFFTLRQSAVEQIVHDARSSRRQVRVAHYFEPRVEQALGAHCYARRNLDLHQVRAAVLFAGYLLQGAALITQARFIDQRAKAVVISNHLCPRRRKPVAKHRLGNAQDPCRFFCRKSQNFFQHQCGLLFRRKRARNARKTKRDVFANFEAEAWLLH